MTADTFNVADDNGNKGHCSRISFPKKTTTGHDFKTCFAESLLTHSTHDEMQEVKQYSI